MNNEDKPFPCTIGSCKQRFANADHLHVHCMKHEMSLKSLDTPIINLDDTTPTPTRFLKNENTAEDGLFSDLVQSTNPFDMEFRKASEKRRISQDVKTSPPMASLETPETKQSETDSGLGSEPIMESVTEAIVTDITTLPSVSVVPPLPILQDTMVHDPVPTNEAEEVVEGDLQVVETMPPVIQEEQVSIPAPLPKYEPPLPPMEQPKATPVLIQNHTPVQQLTQLGQQTPLAPIQPAPVPAPVPAPAPAQPVIPLQAQASSLHSIVNSLPTNITAPLLIKLPGGQQIRVVPSVVANPSAPVPAAISANTAAKPGVAKPAMETANFNSSGKKAIKEKLKETLLSNQSHGNMNVMAKAVEVRMREQQQVVKKEDYNSLTVVAGFDQQDNLGSQQEKSASAGRLTGSKRSSEEDEPEIKRQKFLERNRAAAMRCREKKKQWVTNLETKAENLTVTNVKLNNEILKLKNEVAHLKQLLLAHKECPVTQMQQRQSQNWQVFHAIKETEEEINNTKNMAAVVAQHLEGSDRTDVISETSRSPSDPATSVVNELSTPNIQEVMKELNTHINEGGVTTITIGEGGVPTVILD